MLKETRKIAEEARAGFTLIEILVAVAIIGTLSALAVPAYMSYLSNSKITAARELISNVEMAVNTYNMKFGKYPSDLSAVTEETADEDPLLEGGLEDPWGNTLAYRTNGKKKPLIYSFGPDGEDGGGDEGSDDITNRRAKK